MGGVVGSPECWGMLDPTYETCYSGTQQSPININPRSPSKTDKVLLGRSANFSKISLAMAFQETSGVWEILPLTTPNPPHDGYLGTLRLGNVFYWAEKALLRSPAEHTIDGQRHDLELQMYFQRRDSDGLPRGRYLAVAMFFKVGQKSA